MFRIISDLHLECMDTYILPETWGEDETVLILAGDICEFRMIDDHECFQNFLEDCNRRFRMVVYVPGNHEYYGSSLNQFPKWKEIIETRYPKIRVIDQDTINVPMKLAGNREINFKIVGATLWTDLNNQNPLTMLEVRRYMDFRKIMNDFRPERMIEENDKARKFIRYALMDSMEDHDPVIVVTHHGPTMKSVPPKYENMGISKNSFWHNTGLQELFELLPLKLWVHGHTHDSIDHLLGHGCRVVCNPKGLSSYRRIYCEDGFEVRHQNQNYEEFLVLSAEDLYF